MRGNRIGPGWLALAACLGCAHPQAMKTQTATEVPSPAVAPAATCGGQAECAAAPACTDEVKEVVRNAVLHFDFDSDRLTPLSEQYLTNLAQTLKACPAAKVQVEGNCDERGTEEYNLALGERRAEVAKRYLVTLGVPVTQMETLSYGEEKPVDPRHDEEAWAMNRRDDFKLEAGGPTATR